MEMMSENTMQNARIWDLSIIVCDVRGDILAHDRVNGSLAVSVLEVVEIETAHGVASVLEDAKKSALASPSVISLNNFRFS